MLRFYTIKQNTLPPNEILDSKKLEDGSLWFRLKLHKTSGKLKKIILIIDFTVASKGITVIKANGRSEDGYVWIEQNWETIEKNKDFTEYLSSIWNNVFGDTWPLNVDPNVYSTMDFGDLLYTWQVLIKNPNLTLTASELGWVEELKKMNSMYRFKDSAKFGSSNPSYFGNRHDTVVKVNKIEVISDLDASNVKDQMNWTKGQYSSIKKLKLVPNQIKEFIQLNEFGFPLDWIESIYLKYGKDLFHATSNRYYNKTNLQNDRWRGTFESRSAIMTSFGDIIYNIQQNPSFTKSEMEHLTYKMLKDRMSSMPDDYREANKYMGLLKDVMQYSRVMKIKISASDIPKGNEYIDHVEKVSTYRNGLGYTMIDRIIKKFKIQILHDKLYKDYKIMQNEITNNKFLEVCKSYSTKYEKEIGDFAFIVPKNPQELIEEGNKQSHCVGGYVNDFADERCAIIFMRNKKDINKSLITIEMRGNNLIQAKGSCNRDAMPNEKRIINKWIKTL